MPLSRLSLALSSLLIAAIPSHAHAAEAAHALGDWAGLRTSLADAGIDVSLGYTSEEMANTQGGERTVGAHSGQLVLGAKFDLEQQLGWHGASLQLTLSQRDGENINARAGLGVLLNPHEIHGRGEITRLTQFWLDQSLFDNRVQLRVGRLNVGADFDDLPCDFNSTAFCGSQPGNIAGDYWYNWPVSQWGLIARYNFNDAWYLKAGAYQVTPSYLDTRNGLVLNASGTIGTLSPAELGWQPVFGDGLKGRYLLGGWYSSAPRQDVLRDVDGGIAALSDQPLAMRTGAYGGYFSINQQLTRGDAGVEGSGLRGFFNVVSTDQRTGSVDRSVSAGLIQRGIGARLHDEVGLALAASRLNPREAQTRALLQSRGLPTTAPGAEEYVAELYYGIQVTPWLAFRPMVQWTGNPGGIAAREDVLMVGARTVINF